MFNHATLADHVLDTAAKRRAERRQKAVRLKLGLITAPLGHVPMDRLDRLNRQGRFQSPAQHAERLRVRFWEAVHEAGLKATAVPGLDAYVFAGNLIGQAWLPCRRDIEEDCTTHTLPGMEYCSPRCEQISEGVEAACQVCGYLSCGEQPGDACGVTTCEGILQHPAALLQLATIPDSPAAAVLNIVKDTQPTEGALAQWTKGYQEDVAPLAEKADAGEISYHEYDERTDDYLFALRDIIWGLSDDQIARIDTIIAEKH